MGVKTAPLLSLAMFYWSLSFSSQPAWCQSVRVDFGGGWLQPLVNRSDNLTILTNSNPIFQLMCIASYPTEWVGNFDDLDVNEPGRHRTEWSDRKFDTSIDEASYNYIAWMQLQYHQGLREEERVVCRSIANHADNVLVKLRPEAETEQMHITKHPNEGHVETSGAAPAPASCNLKFEVTQVANKYYWRCLSATGHPQIKMYTCGFSGQASFCANKFRNIKALPTCLADRSDLASAQVITDPTWNAMSSKYLDRGGVAVCSASGWDRATNPERAAVEFFFEGKKEHFRTGALRKLRFSQPGVDMKDLIWMSPPISKDTYTVETLKTSCHVPKYGFGFDPVVIVTLNGSRLLLDRGYTELGVGEEAEEPKWSKDVSVNLQDTGPGTYEVQCIAPVWNTTEWANHTRKVQVKEAVPPWFESGFDPVNVTFEEGDINKRLVCDATGDPLPRVNWDFANTPGARVDSSDDRALVFTRMSVVLHDGSLITCTAQNDYNQRITKSFHVRVLKKNFEKAENAKEADTSIATTTIIAIVAALIFGILLVAGLVFLYFKFLKLGSAIATYLTYDEVKEFREGKKLAAAANTNAVSNPGYANADAMQKQKEEEEQAVAIESLPYNSEFEVAKENFFVDMNSELGSGEYGIVYKGHIKLNPRDQSPLPVAVKTVRKNVHINYFKALMSELKILAYIGHHDYIVNLIGAYSHNIKNRELYVGVELCKTSLLRFLQDNRQSFKNFVQRTTGLLTDETSFSDYANQSSGAAKTMTTFDLIRWAAEIASGMEFLSKKRVVHGDLAARNILISFELNAKICDFGLARQLIDYNYIKSQQCPLPWKWMAIESLSQMKFSTMSDAWAYGVTLWEIFSLGNVPYPGMAWNMDFVDQLLNGLRMSKPAYASDVIYNVMLECWRENPKERPKFSELKQVFQSLEVK